MPVLYTDADKLIKVGSRFFVECMGALNPSTSLNLIHNMGSDNLQIGKFQNYKDAAKVQSWARTGLVLIENYNKVMTKMAEETKSQKEQLISAQEKIIKLQDELLASKTVQLESMKSTVKTTVEEVGNVVKAELNTYSEAVCKSPGIQPSAEELKTAVRNVVTEEDRSRSVMIFGLSEEKEEHVEDRVCNLFLNELGEKPRVDACRIGNESTEKQCRPIKVSLSSSAVVRQILSKARKLKNSQTNSSVFICPDRSPVEQEKHRQLVSEIKNLAKDKTRKYFIRGGKVCSTEINPSVT